MLEAAADLTASGECGGGPAGFLGDNLGVDAALDDQGEPMYNCLSWDSPRVSKWRDENYHMLEFATPVTKEELEQFWHQYAPPLWRMEM
jgi:hypothetical protein